MARVINIRKANLKKLGYRDLEHWLEDTTHVYIGRNMVFYVPGAVKSKWANPFTVKKYGRDECVKMYREYILKNKELMAALPELEGKTMGCWCSADDESCHGNILVELVKDLKITQQ